MAPHSQNPDRAASWQSSGRLSLSWRRRAVAHLVLMLAIVIILFAPFGCNGQKSSTPKEESGALSTASIAIGAILPLTGDAAAYGQSMKRGMELAFSQLPCDGKLLFEDSQADPKQAVSAYQKLRDLHEVTLVLGPFTSGETLAVAPIAERDQTVIVSTGASAPEISQAGEYTFRIVTSDLYDADVLARYIAGKFGASRPAILYINNAYGRGVKDAFRTAVAESSIDVVAAEAYDPSAADFRSVIQRTIAANPDVLVLVGHQEMGRVLRQIREAGSDIPVVSTGLFEDPAILKSAGESAENVHYSFASFDPADKEPLVAEFVQLYNGKYDAAPDILAALGFDAVRLAAHVTDCKQISGPEIKSRLLSVQGFSSVTGDMTFDARGDVVKSFGIKKVEDGQFRWVQRRF
jgi:branched-chain amino acid transport system substrate-binding protein